MVQTRRKSFQSSRHHVP